MGIPPPRSSYRRLSGYGDDDNYNHDDDSPLCVFRHSPGLPQMPQKDEEGGGPDSALARTPLSSERWAASAVVFVLFLGTIAILYPMMAESRSLELETRKLLEKIRGSTDKIRLKSEELEEAFRQGRSLKEDVIQLESTGHQMKLSILGKIEEEDLEMEMRAVRAARLLESEIQAISRREAMEYFGPGPHRVEFKVQFLTEKGRMAEVGTFLIELCSLEYTPHSVEHFLGMVNHKLWDGMAFVHFADHIIQAVAKDYRSAESVQSRFKEAGLSQLAFPEYHSSCPHDKYTLGFSGRPGGLEFFINTQDNTQVHGPGGQTGYDLFEEAEPCFGTVIKGFEVVDKIYQKGLEEGRREVNVVGIRSARIV